MYNNEHHSVCDRIVKIQKGRDMGMLEIRDALTTINFLLVIFMTIFFAYQTVFIAVGFIAKRVKKKEDDKNVPFGRYAAITSARNEEAVIAQLITSLKAQDYPSDLLDIYVIADNCTDKTAIFSRR